MNLNKQQLGAVVRRIINELIEINKAKTNTAIEGLKNEEWVKELYKYSEEYKKHAEKISELHQKQTELHYKTSDIIKRQLNISKEDYFNFSLNDTQINSKLYEYLRKNSPTLNYNYQTIADQIILASIDSDDLEEVINQIKQKYS